jgi:hypothetical protein
LSNAPGSDPDHHRRSMGASCSVREAIVALSMALLAPVSCSGGSEGDAGNGGGAGDGGSTGMGGAHAGPVTDAWSSLPPLALPRHGFGAAVIDGRVYLPGGATREGGGATDYVSGYDVE